MKKILCLLLAVSLMACNAGCSSGSASDRENESMTDPNSVIKDTSAQAGPKAPGVKSQGLSEANRQFAFDIFKQLSKEDKNQNIFISPLSISVALSMAYQGADGSTKTAMENALGYDGINKDDLNESYRKLLGYLNKVDKNVELNISNSVWIRDGKPVSEEFLETNEDVFGAKAAVIDFSGKNAADTINGWISKSTKGKIDKIISPPINQDVLMYLINAIYFKGHWTKKFDTRNTFSAEFSNADGTKSKVMMMSREGRVEYASGENYKAVRLPYGSGKTAMYLILPEEGTDLDEFIAGLRPEFWGTLKSSLSATDDVKLQVPRFKLEYGAKELRESLSALGMGKAFSGTADFSGIRENIYISSVLHKAVIEVNEEGSEAAGVTSVEVQFTAAALEPVSFIADRPFIFAIAEDDTNTILFLGKVIRL